MNHRDANVYSGDSEMRPSGDSNKKKSDAVVVGIAAGISCVFAVALAILVLVLYRRTSRKRKQETDLHGVDLGK